MARIQDIAIRMTGSKKPSNEVKSHLMHATEISAKLTSINENDNYYQGAGIAEYGDEKKACDLKLMKSLKLSKNTGNL